MSKITGKRMGDYDLMMDSPLYEATIRFRLNRTTVGGSVIVQELEQMFIDSMGEKIWVAIPFVNNF